MKEKVFLSASWEYLAMFNYVVDPAILHPYLPPYTEVDLFNDKALVSVVGFMFNNTRIAGIKWPGHTNFEEVNLRFYIKHFDGKRWKRGVAFVSEIVPRPIIAVTANLLYNEHYSTSKMFHNIRILHNELLVEYNWKKTNQKWNSMEIVAGTALMDIMPGSEEEFIFEHYFGYNQLKKNITIEYAVEHPRWQVYPIHISALKCDVKSLYGTSFVPFIEGITPESVFLAKGSEVIVRKPLKITTGHVDPALSKTHK
ncbi:MAG: YqjF family protein [Chitinophagaceae bacterium]